MLLGLPDPCVVLLVGAAGSGKSTLAGVLAAQSPSALVVSYDGCREEISGDAGDQSVTPQAVALARRRIAARCAAGLSTVVDGTHTKREHRRAVLDIAEAHRVPVVAVAIAIELSVCLMRQETRRRVVPAEVVAEQHAEVIQALGVLHGEGFAAVHILLDGQPQA